MNIQIEELRAYPCAWAPVSARAFSAIESIGETRDREGPVTCRSSPRKKDAPTYRQMQTQQSPRDHTCARVAPRGLRVVVAVNDQGRRIGETHHNALISDALVDQIRARREDDGLAYKDVAREFSVALSTVKKICTYVRRAQTAERWKTIRIRKGTCARSLVVCQACEKADGPVSCRPGSIKRHR
jgi:hypothetical protein